MNSYCKFFIAGMVMAIGMPVLAQTNQELLQERLITPALYELLNSRGANTPEQRMEVIFEACQAGRLGPDVCYRPRRRRD